VPFPDPDRLIHSTASGEWVGGGIVGPYRLEACLGRGGAGEVWRVTHLPTGAQRALKTLLPFAELQDRERFVREGQALATLDGHPHVVRVHEVGELAGRAYLVMDLARSEDLNARLKAGPLPAEEARQLLIKLASGLAHVHRHGLLHRDLKPHNVLFADDGRPLLSDFGLVRGPSRSSLSVTGEILGTPAYMAPEQAMGEPVDERTDVYGLGAVLYHVLCGRPPFQGPTPIAVLTQVAQEPPRPPSSVAAEVPPDLERVCLRALAKDPNQRYPSARALGDALTTPEAPPLRWARPLLVVSVLGAGLALGALARTLNTEAPPPPPTPSQLLATSSQLEPEPETEPEPDPGVTVDLDGFLATLDLDEAIRKVESDTRYAKVAFALEGFRKDQTGNTLNLGTNEVYETLQLALRGVPPKIAAPFYYKHALDTERPNPDVPVALSKAHGWYDFARYVGGVEADSLELTTVTTHALANAILERGAARGSWRCARQLGQYYQDGARGLRPDLGRAFALQVQGTPPPDHKDYDPHFVGLAQLLKEADPLEAPPEQVLQVVEVAVWVKANVEDREISRFLTQKRYELEREVGMRVLSTLRGRLDTAANRERIEANPAYRQALALGDRPQALLLAGQQLNKEAGQIASGETAEQATKRERLLREAAALAFLAAAEEGLSDAWNDLGNLASNLEPLGSVMRRQAVRMEANWRAAESGNLRAIAGLGNVYRIRCLQHEADLPRLQQVFEYAPETLTFAGLQEEYQKLKLVAAAAYLSLKDSGFRRWPRASLVEHLEHAIHTVDSRPLPDEDPWHRNDRGEGLRKLRDDAEQLLEQLRTD